MTAQQIRTEIATIEAEQARIWTPTGSTVHDDDSITIHGVTPDTIRQVAKMNSRLTGLRLRLHRQCGR